MNINVRKENNCLADIFNVHNVKNIIDKATCYKNCENPTLIDLAITNVPKRLKSIISIDTGLSDFHNMICFATKMHVEQRTKKRVLYRSYKHFDEKEYINDLSELPLQVAEIFDSADDAYWFYEQMIKTVIDKHAPLKQRIISHRQVPYMNSELRKAINVRNMLRRKFDKNKTKTNWLAYSKHRNTVTKMRKKSRDQYIREKCTKTQTGRDFWNTVKPMMSSKSSGGDTDITIFENGKVITKPQQVGNVLNDYYVNVTKSIGMPDEVNEGDEFSDITNSHHSDESIIFIRDKLQTSSKFSFHLVSTDDVCKKLRTLNPRKATGHDGIPPKLLKLGAHVICNTLTSLVNMSISTSIFPNTLKYAEVTPIYKKDDMLDKKNYRPVSVLPCLSKVYESILLEQLESFLQPMLSPYLSGFRAGHSCQSVLLRFVEKTKAALDKGTYCGAILTDLSKAFDCLPYRLLISKLSAYGVSEQACQLISNYFCGRKQRVKLGSIKSEWKGLSKGAPQGSLFGPFMFNIFQNDLLYLIGNECDIFNYADDNTISCYGSSATEVCDKLIPAIDIVLKWFKLNYMQANPNKFQFIMFGKDANKIAIDIDEGIRIESETDVKLLGIIIDDKLSFDKQIKDVCSKAGKKINALARLSKTLETEAKLNLFQAFVLCQFNYCPIVWHYCSTHNTKKVEKLQYRALRYVFNDYLSTYSELRVRAGRPTLYAQRRNQILLEIFKIIHGKGPNYLRELCKVKDTGYDLRNSIMLSKPKCTTTKYGLNSFRYNGATIWNKQHADTTNMTRIQEFKRRLKDCSDFNCTCNDCVECMINIM